MVSWRISRKAEASWGSAAEGREGVALVIEGDAVGAMQ
jgi:hypothetical protein